ncbi:MAG: metallo-beta-lactamase superfamily [Rhodospirillales bacterium]|nr:metallo-beta-lactamase superfamily [Rhodospirillales bacterium]
MSTQPYVELTYPFAEPPAHDSYIEVAPGIRWLRFPLPFALNHINLYLLDDGDGWVLVDTGIKSEISYELWRKHFETTLEGRPITRVIGTHFHPDHVGCAEWLVKHWNAEFLTSRTEWLTATMLQSETAINATAFWGEYYRAAGLDDETLRAVATRGENYAERVGQIPRPFTRLADGDQIEIGGRIWHIIIGTGHSPELITLYSAEDRLFISSDQVLPGISPNISVQAPEPYADPLTEFLDSCAKLTALDPETYVLPMHGRPFYRLHERLEELVRHHGERLALTIEACRTPITIVELLPIMFKRKLDFQQTQFAIGEALAHTNHLVVLGDLERIVEPGQPLRFQSSIG